MDAKTRRLVIPIVLVIGVLLLAMAVVYFLIPADALPSVFPGHVSGEADQLHTKHGIAALIVALACFVFAWFQTGPKSHQAA